MKKINFAKLPGARKKVPGQSANFISFLKNIRFLGQNKKANKSEGLKSAESGSGEEKQTDAKSFDFRSLFGGVRGKIACFVILIVLIPLTIQAWVNVKSQSDIISQNIGALNQAVNQNLVNKIDSRIKQNIDVLTLIPQSADILAVDEYQQERAMRKIAGGDQGYKEVTLIDKYGTIIFSTKTEFNNTSVADKPMFTEAMKGTNYISDSEMDAKFKIPVITISIPINDQSLKPAGVIAVKMDLEEMYNLCKNTKIGSKSTAYVIDKNGMVIAHPQFSEKVLKGYNAVQHNIKGAVLATQGKEGSEIYKDDKGKQVLGTFKKIPTTGWSVITEVDKAEAYKPISRAVRNALILSLCALIFAVAGSFGIAAFVTKPLISMVKVAGEIKDGNLQKRIPVTSNDEIGLLQSAFNRMTDSLCDVISQVDAAVSEITAASETLSDNAQIGTAATEEIIAVVENVADGSLAQIDSVTNTIRIAREISESVETAAGKTQIVAVSAKEAAQVAEDGSKNINIINTKINMIKDNVVNSASLVEKLGEKSQEVTGIVKVIRDISGKTNMLALNAAIEAARAGEAGRGFAVVANEIRNLADQTGEASQNIEALLLQIQKETQNTVAAMQDGLIEVEEGTAAITAAYGIFDKIIKEVYTVAEEIETVSESVLGLKAESGRVLESVSLVSEIAEQTSGGAQSVLARTEEQSSAMQEINTSTSNLSDMAKGLQKLVHKFKH